MKNQQLKSILFAVIILIVLIVPNNLLAQQPQQISPNQGPSGPDLIGYGDTTLRLEDFIISILNIIIGLLALITVIILIYAGFQYLTSGGDADKAKTARKTIEYALIGLVIIVFAAVITNYIFSVFYSS